VRKLVIPFILVFDDLDAVGANADLLPVPG
jgi:hypothetical protein